MMGLGTLVCSKTTGWRRKKLLNKADYFHPHANTIIRPIKIH